MPKNWFDVNKGQKLTVLVDSGFWIALGNRREKYRNDDVNKFWKEYRDFIGKIKVPYATLPEFMNSRLASETDINHFETLKNILRGNPLVEFLDKEDYLKKWDIACRLFWDKTPFGGYAPSSISDIIISLMIKEQIKPFVFLTLNKADFLEVATKNRNCTLLDFQDNLKFPT
jgi:hypothetical protein